MRIGIVTGEYPPMQGGVGAFSHILAGELQQQGQAVYVFSSREARSSDGIDVTNTADNWHLPTLQAVHRWAVEKHLDVVNLQFQTAAFAMSPWIHFLPEALGKTPLVTTFHDLRHPYLFPKAGRLRDWIVMKLARGSDGVIVTNQEDQARLKHLPKVCLIPIGSNILQRMPANFDAEIWRTKAGAKTGDFLLAYFGLFNRTKGLEILLHSMAKLRTAGIPLRLVMIGGVGTSDPTNAAYADEIQQLIDKLGLQDYIYQAGYLDEAAVGAFLTASDAVVLPFLDGASYRRGSLMAAIRYHTAILTTTPQVHIPAFQHRENMLLVKAGDQAALESAIQQLYESPQLRQRLREGAGRLAGEFEWPKIARETTNHLRWVIEESV